MSPRLTPAEFARLEKSRLSAPARPRHRVIVPGTRRKGQPTAMTRRSEAPGRSVTKMRQRPERELVAAILDALRRVGVSCWRVTTGHAVMPSGRRVRVGVVGQSDILGFVPVACPASHIGVGQWPDGFSRLARYEAWGALADCVTCGGRGFIARFLAVEVKSATGRVSPEQRAYLAGVERGGGLAFLARAVDDVLPAVLRAMGR